MTHIRIGTEVVYRCWHCGRPFLALWPLPERLDRICVRCIDERAAEAETRRRHPAGSNL